MMYTDDFEEDDIRSLDDIDLSFVCEDCDYKWDSDNDYDMNVDICPMCGSENTLEITE